MGLASSMRSILFQASAFVVLLAATGCGRLQVQTRIQSATAIPAVMQGEWRGSWTSATSATQGRLQARLQVYGDRPVVRFVSDHPCLQGQNLRFVLVSRRIEIRVDDRVLFGGEVTLDQHAMQGTYECGSDHGLWSATWSRALPPIGDVSGSWLGEFQAQVPPLHVALQLQLQQHYDDGVLRISGDLSVPGTDYRAPIHDGIVEWSDAGFQLLLRSDPMTTPLVQLQGFGSPDGVQVPEGMLLLVPGNGLPTVAGSWTAALLAR